MTEKRNKSFKNEYAENQTRFSKPIKKFKVVHFASSNFQKKNKSPKVIFAKFANIQGKRYIFGTLLYLAVTNGINLNIIFNYPIPFKPPCFINPNITVQSTIKVVTHHYWVKDGYF